MATRVYPIWKPGAPQLRVFLPNFTMVLLKPKYGFPANQALFRVDMKMTATDVKNYLRKIYNVPVVRAETEVKRPKMEKHPVDGHDYRKPDWKEATVYFEKDFKFEFPNIAPEEKKVAAKKEDAEYTDLLDKMRQNNVKNWDRAGTPTWFSF